MYELNRKPAVPAPSPAAARCNSGAKWAMTLSHGLAPGCGADEAWAVIGSFGGLHRWLPTVEVCDIIEGQDGIPGCVRYVAGKGRRPDGSPQRWVLEKLLDLSSDRRSFSYSILDSSYGFEEYTACFSVCADPSSHGVLHGTSNVVTWSFEMSPTLAGSRHEVFNLLTDIFNRMMGSLESTLLGSGSGSESGSTSAQT